jgi:zinc/manganese transport system substrate-binding protein
VKRFVNPARAALAAAAVVALLLTGCGQAAAPPATTSSPGDKIRVVASTNVYADIAATIGGEKVEVSSIINKLSQDPHSYEATAQDKLAVSKAQLVIENGGGYDDFLTRITSDSKISPDHVVSAVAVSGLDRATTPKASPAEGHGEFNEHVWYSFDAMAKLADAVALKLGQADSAAAETFTTNAATFKTSLAGLRQQAADIRATSAGSPVAVTEPVPLYLLEAAGLENKTPEEYSSAIEEGTDVSPAVLQETTKLITSRNVRFLAYNDQTEGPQTEALKTAAMQAQVPVVNFTETLPDGMNYLQWMRSNLEEIAKAIRQ